MPRKPSRPAWELAEEALVASVIHCGLEAIPDRVSGAEFVQPSMGAAFTAAISLSSQGHRPTPESVAVEAARLSLVPIDVPSLRSVCQSYSVTSPRDVERLSKDVLRFAHLRKIESECRKAIADIRNGVQPEELVNQIQVGISSVHSASSEPNDFTDVAKRVVDMAVSARALGKPPGISCGIREMDRILGNLVGGRQIIVAGRPSMGKSTLLLNMIDGMLTANPGHGAYLVCQEMSMESLIQKSLSSRTGVCINRILTGSLSEGELDALRKGALSVHEKRYFMSYNIRSMAEMVSRVRWVRSRMESAGVKLSVVALDYIQLLAEHSERSREQSIAEISRALKLLAVELDVTTIIASQLNRAVENREGRRPQLSDLRESGSIEQDADQVCFVFRESFYDGNAPDNESEIIVGKNRWGEVGSVRLGWDGSRSLFYNM